MNETQSARRYARAIIETAADARAVKDDLDRISEALRANPALFEALSNPAVPGTSKKTICAEIFTSPAAPLPRLFDMLIDASKIELLPEIARRYRDEWNARHNVHSAKVFTALELDPDARERVREAIEAAVSGRVELEVRVDPALVGGLKVEVDGHLFDGSVKARLQALRQHLLQA